MSDKNNRASSKRPTSIRNDDQPDNARALQENVTKTTASSSHTGGESVALKRYMEHLQGNMSGQDVQSANTLIQQHPHLSECFIAVAGFMITMEQSPTNYRALSDQISALSAWKSKQDILHVGSFAVALGFVERSVNLYHQIMFEKGLEHLSRFEDDFRDAGTECLYRITSAALNFTSEIGEYGLRLAQTGVLNNFMNDIIHLRNEADHRLGSGRVYFQSLGCVYNCSMDVRTLPIIRALTPVDNIRPFLARKTPSIKLLTLLTLANIMDDAQNELLLTGGAILEFLLNQVQYAWRGEGSPFHVTFSWSTEGLLHGLRGLAKNDVNKRRICDKGALPLLVSILVEGTEDEKLEAAAVLWELAFDKENSKLIRRNQQLMRILDEVKNSAQQSSGHAASAVWVVRDRTHEEPYASAQEAEGRERTPRLLNEQSNMLTILGTTSVEFVLTQLRNPISSPGGQGNVIYTRVEVLQALAHLMMEKTNRDEMLAKDGLKILIQILEEGSDEEKIHLMEVLSQMASHSEFSAALKAYPRLVALAKEVRWSGNNRLAHVAQNLVWTIEEGASSQRQGASDNASFILVSCHKSDTELANQVSGALRHEHYTVRQHEMAESASDADDLGAATPTETAQMVEGAAAVVVCVSYRYKLSSHCRMECEYAAKLKKELVAARVDADYKPDGWLQTLLRNVKVTVDVTNPSTFDRGLQQLVAALGNLGKAVG